MFTRSLRTASLGLALVATSPSVEAQDRPAQAFIEAGPNHIVSAPNPARSRNEVWLAASRKDPNSFVAVYHASGDVSVTGCESSVSKDGGQTWRRFILPEETDCFDPMVAAGANGQFYISYSAWRAPNPRPGNWRGVSAPIRIYTSLDDGNTWSAPVDLVTPLRPDHQRNGVDMSGGKFDGRVYVAWVEFPAQTVPGKFHTFLHYLDPEGRTQSAPKLVHMTEEARPVSLEPLVLSDGTLLVPIWYQVFYYGGTVAALDPAAERRSIYLVRSTDGGETFGPLEKVVEVMSPMWRTRMHRFGSQANPPIFAVDNSASSKYRDRLYAVWNDTRAGTTTDIWLVWSGDKGRTWSPPVKVNDFAAPESETEPPDVRVTPVVAVNREGVVGVAWYDRREDPTRRCWKQYFSASLDGGQSFLKNQAVSTVPSCPPPNKPPVVEVYTDRSARELRSWEDIRADARRTGADYGAGGVEELTNRAMARVRADAGRNTTSRINISFDPSRNEFQGHYTGLAAAADGSFMAVWADARRGNQEMYSARVKVGTAAPSMPNLESRKLNDAVDVNVGDVSYDDAQGLTTMQVKLHNRSDRPIYPPLVLRVRNVAAGAKNIAGNADKESEQGVGAEWDFSGLLGTQKRLDPGMMSEPRVVKVRTSAKTGLDVIIDYDIAGRTPSGR